MTDTITETEIREKLANHYAGDNEFRDLVKNKREDAYNSVGSIVYSLEGSPPKGYAIYTPESRRVSLYDNRGKRFRILQNTVVES
jgi:hypothetical protein